MATAIPRAVLEFVTSEVNGISADAQARVLAVLESITWTPENIAECRDIVLQALAAIMPTYTDAAAQVGADMYDAVRETAVGGAMGATAVSGYELAATAGAVRAFVQDIVDGKPIEVFNRKVLSRVDRDVRRAENISVAENAMRDPLKPKYARVPSGSETCGFCLMLSSFGFHYSSRSAASHAHDNCDCRVVAQFGESRVEDYDPEDMYEHYKQCLDSLGGTSGIRKQWKSLPEDERKKRIEEHGGKESDAFKAFLNGRISAEIETRDPEWFRTGKAPEIRREPKAEPNQRELATADRLAADGFVVTFRATRSSEGKRTSDILIGGVPWEIKQPHGSGKNNVYNQFNEASGQSDKLVIDASTSPFGFDGVVERAAEALSRRSDFTEVLVVDDKSLRRISKAR